MTGQTRQGHCLCGAARFSARVTKDHADACHCGMCRRWAGGPFIGVEVTDLAFDQQAPRLVYRSSEWAERISCASCGGSLAWRMRDGSFASVPTGVFDPPLDLPVQVEIYIDEKPAGYAFAGVQRQLTCADVVAGFQGKMG